MKSRNATIEIDSDTSVPKPLSNVSSKIDDISITLMSKGKEDKSNIKTDALRNSRVKSEIVKPKTKTNTISISLRDGKKPSGRFVVGASFGSSSNDIRLRPGEGAS